MGKSCTRVGFVLRRQQLDRPSCQLREELAKL